MKPDNLKSLIDRDEEENAVTAVYLAVFCFLIIGCSVGAFLWWLFNEIFVK